MTDKNKPFSFKNETAERLVKEMDSVDELVIVHGGGSFGHPGAMRYELNSPSPKEPARGTAEVQKAMRVFNLKIIDLMLENNLWAVSIPGGMITTFEDGDMKEINTKIVKDYLDLGAIPVTFGDVAIDHKRQVTICSGDDLMLGLAPLADTAIFVTDVDGIYKEGEIVDMFDPDMLPLRDDDFLKSGEGVDVTGGMERKTRLMLNIAEKCPTYIVNGSVPGRLSTLLEGKKTICTEVRP